MPVSVYNHVPAVLEEVQRLRSTLLSIAGTQTSGPMPGISEEELEALCR